MAPTTPKSRPRTKLPKSQRPAHQSIHTRTPPTSNPTQRSSDTTLESFNSQQLSSHSSLPASKRDKRQIKHALLLNRLKNATPGSSVGTIQKKRLKSRENTRKKTQLKARLGELGDALPDAQIGSTVGKSSSAVDLMQGLKTKPGHVKRLEKLKALERERFKANLGVMSEGKDTEVENGNAKKADTKSKRSTWEALRAHITAQQGQG